MNKDSYQETLMKNYHDQIKAVLIECHHFHEVGGLNQVELAQKINDLVTSARVDGLNEENIYLLLVLEKRGLEQYYQKPNNVIAA
jgi:hypothetical protein